jgi:hypothetical protein
VLVYGQWGELERWDTHVLTWYWCSWNEWKCAEGSEGESDQWWCWEIHLVCLYAELVYLMWFVVIIISWRLPMNERRSWFLNRWWVLKTRVVGWFLWVENESVDNLITRYLGSNRNNLLLAAKKSLETNRNLVGRWDGSSPTAWWQESYTCTVRERLQPQMGIPNDCHGLRLVDDSIGPKVILVFKTHSKHCTSYLTKLPKTREWEVSATWENDAWWRLSRKPTPYFVRTRRFRCQGNRECERLSELMNVTPRPYDQP